MAARDPILRRRVAADAAKARWATGPEAIETRQRLKAEALERHIRRLVMEAPPLSDEQRNRLALLLRGGAAA